MLRVAGDESYLTETLRETGSADAFTGKLLWLLEASREAREARRAAGREFVLAFLRSDYMLHGPTGSLLQVEINTISVSFAALGGLTAQAHRYVLEKSDQGKGGGLGEDAARGGAGAEGGAVPNASGDAKSLYSARGDSFFGLSGVLPANDPAGELAAALARAARLHAGGASAAPGAVAFIVQPGEMNAYDQQWVQTRLWTEHGVRAVRLTLREIAERGELRSVSRPASSPDGASSPAPPSSALSSSSAVRQLYVDDGLISVAYFRSGYTPEDHPSELEWSARLLIERSDAVKCPDVTLHLAGAKKIQQDLARPGRVERFLAEEDAAFASAEASSSSSSPSPSASVRALFAGLWGLSAADLAADASAREAVADAIERPEEYVLKPQREGGGNNLYGPELAARLKTPAGLEAFILMQRIKPPPARSVLLRKGRAVEVDALCELGIYSVVLVGGTQPEPVLDRTAGHLVRTKPADSDEGGVAAGFAVLDSPFLVD